MTLIEHYKCFLCSGNGDFNDKCLYDKIRHHIIVNFTSYYTVYARRISAIDAGNTVRGDEEPVALKQHPRVAHKGWQSSAKRQTVVLFVYF